MNPPTTLSVVETDDGSKTLYCSHYRQTYHSTYGALTESQHVFIDAAGVSTRLATHTTTKILEVGLGTGLNFLLAARAASQFDAKLEYTAVEKRLLSPTLLTALDYKSIPECAAHYGRLTAHIERCGHVSTGRLPSLRSEKTTLILLRNLDDLLGFYNPKFHIIFLDAFSPEVNPELWTVDALNMFYHLLLSGGVLTTYCAKGVVRRALERGGFLVSRLPGPPGKREILACHKP